MGIHGYTWGYMWIHGDIYMWIYVDICGYMWIHNTCGYMWIHVDTCSGVERGAGGGLLPWGLGQLWGPGVNVLNDPPFNMVTGRFGL